MAPGRGEIQWGYYLDVMTDHLEAVYRRQIDHLLILTPPGCLKSVTACVAYPAWVWVQDPGVQFTCGSNSDSNVKRDSVACRNLINHPWYWGYYVQPDPAAPPKWRMRDDMDTVKKFENSRRGWRETVTVGGNVTGLKADVQILDDPNDARKVFGKAYRDGIATWHDQAFHNRVNDHKTARHVMIGQHTHPEDLQSHAIRQGIWEVCRLEERKTARVSCTSIWVDRRAEGELLRPERFGPAQEAREKQILGANGYQAQHQQNPQRREGKFFDRSRVSLAGGWPAGCDAVRYFDLASGVDESGCATVGVLMARDGDGRYYVCHAARMWEGPHRRNQAMRHVGQTDERRTGLRYRGLVFEKQPASAGKDQAEEIIRNLAPLNVSAVPSSGDKFVRAEGLAAQWDAGNVSVVRDDDADRWNEWFFDMMEAFGPGSPAELLDTGDAASGAFNELAAAPPTEGAATGAADAGQRDEIRRLMGL